MRIGVVAPMGMSDGPGHLHLVPAPALLAKLAPPPMRSAAAGASWARGGLVRPGAPVVGPQPDRPIPILAAKSRGRLQLAAGYADAWTTFACTRPLVWTSDGPS